MAFFSKNDSSQQNKVTGSSEAISSVISKDMRIIGKLNFTGKARIDGTIEGNIKGEHLILSKSGKVHGDIELLCLVCHGSFVGIFSALGVTIHTSANLHGNLAAENLSVEPGANLNGEISSASQPKKEKTTTAKLPVNEKKTP